MAVVQREVPGGMEQERTAVWNPDPGSTQWIYQGYPYKEQCQQIGELRHQVSGSVERIKSGEMETVDEENTMEKLGKERKKREWPEAGRVRRQKILRQEVQESTAISEKSSGACAELRVN